jgi:hypothetical protein
MMLSSVNRHLLHSDFLINPTSRRNSFHCGLGCQTWAHSVYLPVAARQANHVTWLQLSWRKMSNLINGPTRTKDIGLLTIQGMHIIFVPRQLNGLSINDITKSISRQLGTGRVHTWIIYRTLLEKRILQLFEIPYGFLSGHIFATLKGSSEVS